MSSSIHYKFRTTNVSKTLGFDGQAIKVPELKKAICAAENIKAELFDLMFFNSFNKQPYTGDDEIPRNSSVTVQRVPIENGAKIPKISNPEIAATTKPTPGVPDSAAHIKQEDFSKMTEEERIKHITIQSTFKYTTNNYNRKPMANNMQQAPPDYLCNRCNQLGHFPKACPLLNIRKTTGIPNEELMETTADDPQAMLHPSGKFMIPIMHYKAREQRKLMEEQKKKGVPNSQEQKYKIVKKELPPDLKCPICNDIYKEALVTGCCGESFCADCIQQVMSDAIAADLNSECPNCKAPIGASALFPNNSLRESVEKYKKSLAAPNSATDTVESEEDEHPTKNEPEPLSSPEKTPKLEEEEKSPERVVEVIPPPPIVETEKPVVLPTVNLSAMLAASQKSKQPSLPPPEPVADFSQPPPTMLSQPPPSIPPVVVPVVDFSKPPPNFKLPDLSQPPPFIPSSVPKVNKEVILPKPPQSYNIPHSKPKISESKYDEKDEEEINSVWEKLNVGDDNLDLATLFETRTSYVKQKDDESDAKEKQKRTKLRSKSRERHRREDRRSRSRSPHKKRKESRDREKPSRKRSKEPEYRHKSVEKRSSDYRRKDKERENGNGNGKEKERKVDKEKERKEEKRKSDEQKESAIRDRRHENDNDRKMVKYGDEEKNVVKNETEIKKVKEKVPVQKYPSESPTKKEIIADYEDLKKASSSSQETIARVEVKEREKEKKKDTVKEKELERSKDNGKEREKEKKKDKERDHREKLEKKKSNKKDKTLDTVEREKDKEKKKASSKEKKKVKSEEKKKKKRRKSSDRSDEEEEKQKKKRHKEKKHKKDRKRERESMGDESEDDRRKRRKF